MDPSRYQHCSNTRSPVAANHWVNRFSRSDDMIEGKIGCIVFIIFCYCSLQGGLIRKANAPEYVRRMQQYLFEILAQARSREELQKTELKAHEARARYMRELEGVDVRELTVHRRVSRLNYSRRCAEASAVKAHLRQGISLAPGYGD